jgi:non-canonical purine NTP pyrophosphatase (RdgB/HAM1 family)
MQLSAMTLVTSNAGKAREFADLLGVEVAAQKIPVPEVQALNVQDVVRTKAEAAYKHLGSPVLVDDTGIVFDAWNGLPGALTSWFLETVGNEGLLRMLAGWDSRSASVVTALGYCDGGDAVVVLGQVNGSIPDHPRGTNGFGYDPIFVPEGHPQTFAEMDAAQKNALSMRARAVDALLRRF